MVNKHHRRLTASHLAIAARFYITNITHAHTYTHFDSPSMNFLHIKKTKKMRKNLQSRTNYCISFINLIVWALYILYLKSTMDCCNAESEVFPSLAHSREASITNDFRKCRLGGELTDALNKVLVWISIVCNHLAQRRYHVKGVKVVYSRKANWPFNAANYE